ncbi:MAG: thioredoxin reductase, partial [Halolamina sp.]
PPGCEEIDETERAARQAESRAAMQEYFDAAHEQRQRTHPSLVDDDLGRGEEP